ncbi:MAG: DUF29 domain-containing protein, partial [Hydrogenobacter thermophilus]|nr:DUF29 domain-containing protein [Hydrogenobacter thermophilus]
YLDACISYLAVILEHLYKWDNFRSLTRAGGEKGGLSWIKSVENARLRLETLTERYPSLRTKLPESTQEAWIEAKGSIKVWLNELGYDHKSFNLPSACPYTYEEAMTRDLRKEIEP